MTYYIGNGTNYIWQPDVNGCYQLTDNFNKAKLWESCAKAERVRRNLKKRFGKKSGLSVRKVPVKQVSPLTVDIVEMAESIHAIAQQAEDRIVYLKEELKSVDLELIDIQHAAEFYELNASQGYKLYKLLHDVRVKRRNIKDEIAILDEFLKAKFTSESISALKGSIANMDKRTYAPRVNKELFGV